MTGEDLVKEIRKVDEALVELARKEALSPEEKKRQGGLTVRQAVLGQIKEAQQKQRLNDELYYNMAYSLLTSSWGEKHPFLAGLLLRNFRWSIF